MFKCIKAYKKIGYLLGPFPCSLFILVTCVHGIPCCPTWSEHKVNSGRFVESVRYVYHLTVIHTTAAVCVYIACLYLLVTAATPFAEFSLHHLPSSSSFSSSFLLPYLQWHLLPCAFMCLHINALSEWSVSACVFSLPLGGFNVLPSEFCTAWIHLGSSQGVIIYIWSNKLS